MARSDLLVSLVKAGTAGDKRMFQTAAEAIIAEERAKHHDVLADKLSKAIQPNGNGARPGVIAGEITHRGRDFVAEVVPQRRLEELMEMKRAKRDLEDFEDYEI